MLFKRTIRHLIKVQAKKNYSHPNSLNNTEMTFISSCLSQTLGEITLGLSNIEKRKYLLSLHRSDEMSIPYCVEQFTFQQISLECFIYCVEPNITKVTRNTNVTFILNTRDNNTFLFRWNTEYRNVNIESEYIWRY